MSSAQSALFRPVGVKMTENCIRLRIAETIAWLDQPPFLLHYNLKLHTLRTTGIHTMDKITDATVYLKQNNAKQCSNMSRV